MHTHSRGSHENDFHTGLGRAAQGRWLPIDARSFRGNDKLLIGIILGVITFWLFAQTTLNVAPTCRKISVSMQA